MRSHNGKWHAVINYTILFETGRFDNPRAVLFLGFYRNFDRLRPCSKTLESMTSTICSIANGEEEYMRVNRNLLRSGS